MPENPMTRTLQEQFRRTWRIWKEMIANIPEDQWASGDNDYLIPVRHCYHTLGAAERYASALTHQQYCEQTEYKLNWEGPVDPMPAKDEMLKMFERMEEKVSLWLNGLSDSGLLERETASPWTGERILDKALYLLRHTHHHLGEVAAELVRRGIPRARWTA